MASSNVSAVTSHFPTANEGFSTTLNSTIASGATTLTFNGTSGLTDGTVFVGIIEPGLAGQQTFTGTVNIGGSQITGVKWTRGANTIHLAGVTIVDYVTGTGNNMTTKGIQVHANQDGTLKSSAIESALSGSTGTISTKVLTNPYKFSAYRNTSPQSIPGGVTKIQLNAERYDTGSNFDAITNFRFVAPVTGFYHFSWTVSCAVGAGDYYGSFIRVNGSTGTSEFVGTGFVSYIAFSNNYPGSADVSLTAGDYVELFFNNGSGLNRDIVNGANLTFLTGHLISLT
jgi:hypothetical protein